MNEILKQRLVGAAILVALGVLFWPIIFVQPSEDQRTALKDIPPRPGLSSMPVAAPDRSGLRTSSPVAALAVPEPDVEIKPQVQPIAQTTPLPAAAKAKPLQQAEAPEPRSAPPPALKTDNDGVPVAFILQVASVSSAQKADSLRQRLLDMGQKGYVKKVQRGDQNLYRVYIGPKFERDRLERLQPEIDSTFGVSSIVSRYLP